MTHNVFISYRRRTGSELASLLWNELKDRNYKVFLDVREMETGPWDEQLLLKIKKAKFFLLVLTPSALDRCFNDGKCKDWIHKEIAAAVANKCTIILIMHQDFTWPTEAQKAVLPEIVQEVCGYQGITWNHEDQPGTMNKLLHYMGENEDKKKEIEKNSTSEDVQVIESKFKAGGGIYVGKGFTITTPPNPAPSNATQVGIGVKVFVNGRKINVPLPVGQNTLKDLKRQIKINKCFNNMDEAIYHLKDEEDELEEIIGSHQLTNGDQVHVTFVNK